jgi:hypothetical protein
MIYASPPPRRMVCSRSRLGGVPGKSKATGYARLPAARSSRSPEAPSCRGVVVLSYDAERREWRSSSYSHFACFLPARRESSAFFSLLLSLSHTSDLAGSSSLIILALSVRTEQVTTAEQRPEGGGSKPWTCWTRSLRRVVWLPATRALVPPHTDGACPALCLGRGGARIHV